MSDIDKVAKAEGIRFRHFHDKTGKLVATIATAWNKNGKISCALSMCHTIKPFYKEAKRVLDTLRSTAISSKVDATFTFEDGNNFVISGEEVCQSVLNYVKQLSCRGDTGSKEDGKIRSFNRLKEFLGDGSCEMCINLTPNEIAQAIRGGFILDYFPVPKVELRAKDPDGTP